MTDKRVDIDIQANPSGYKRGVDEAVKITRDLKSELTSQYSDIDRAARRSGEGIKENSKQLGDGAKSAKELQFAMRGLPAQFTDIFTSLQGGQAPIQVLLQQGGQIKDMFGGIGPAAKALGGYVLGLVNPFTIAAVAAASLTGVYYSGWKESDNLARSIISTGNAAGLTVAKINDYSASVGSLTGSYGTARDAAQLLTATGVVGADSMRTAILGVTEATKVTGKEVTDLVSDFVKLSQDPVKGLLDLNNQYHFLTASTYEQVRALKEQGNSQAAAKLAYEAFADAMKDRSEDIQKNMGAIERGWSAIKEAVSGAKDSLLSIGRAPGLDELQKQYDELKKSIERIQKNNSTGFEVRNLAMMEARLANIKTQLDAANSAQSKAEAAAKKTADEQEKINQSQIYQAYTSSAARLSQSQALQRQIDEENKAFAEATKGLQKYSAEYQRAADIHQQALRNINSKAAGGGGKAYGEESKQISSLVLEIEKLDDTELGHIDVLQQKLDAYTKLDPVLRNYLNQQLQQARNAEQLASFEAAVRIGDDNRAAVENDQAARDREEFEQRLKTFGEFKQDLEQSNAALNIDLIASDKERAKAQAELEHQRIVDRINALVLENDQRQELLDAADENYRLNLKKLETQGKSTNNVARELGITFKSSFEDAITSGKSFRDILSGIEQDLIKVAVRKSVTEPLMNGVSNFIDSSGVGDFFSGLFPSAQGNAFAGSALHAFAAGGAFGNGEILTSPTFFRFADGGSFRNGVAGEAGPEAALPLKRLSNGRLGVSTDGSTGGGTVVQIIDNRSANAPAVRTERSQGPNGRDLVRVVIDEVRGDLMRDVQGGGMFSQTIENQYGLSRAAGAQR